MKNISCFVIIIILLSVSPGLLEIDGESNSGQALLSKSGVSDAIPDTVLTPYPAKISDAGLLQKSSELQMSKDFGKIPLYFIPNEGQVDAKARFYAKTSKYTLWMTGKGLVFDKTRTVGAGHTPRRKKESVASKVGGVSAVGGVSEPRPSLLVTGSNKESPHATGGSAYGKQAVL